MESATLDTSAPTKPRRRPSVQPSGRKAGGRTKATLILTAETDLKLTVLAAMQGVDRSVLAERAIAALVRGVVVSFRGERDTGMIGEDAAA